ncbi:MAG: terpene cyclase/mutase family protein [Lentisphaerae bacterium]|nr:terpene cyclase/mutase family protein [Lentisphaerota bacterium]
MPRTRRCAIPGPRLAPLLALVLALLPALNAQAQRPAAPVARVDGARMAGAIAGGLRWLAEHQVREGAEAGSWPVPTANYRPAIASLAGLAFLANGHLPGDAGPYGKNVAAALKYVMRSMAADGYIGHSANNGMYIHDISTLFALSCLGMQTDEALEPDLAEWCRRSLAVIVRSQQITKTAVERGGWRYDPYTTESDVSVTCWQLLVLHTARQAGFAVEPAVFSPALGYLNRAFVNVNAEAGQEKGEAAGGYLYRPGYTYEPSRSTTALVLLIQSLFDASSEQRTRQALAYLRRYPLTWDGAQYKGYFYFSGFYMVQGMFQVGGDDWDSFGPRMAELLLDHQSGDGGWPYPPNNYEQEGMLSTGPAYPVAMAVLMLSLDKQYLPMYQRQQRIYEGGPAGAQPDQTPPAETAAETKPETAGALALPAGPEPAAPAPPSEAAGEDSGWDGTWEEEPDGGIDHTIGRPVFK